MKKNGFAAFQDCEAAGLRRNTSVSSECADSTSRMEALAALKASLGEDLACVLRSEGEDSYFCDSNLRRFLEGNDMAVAATAKQVRATIAWRATMDCHAARLRLIAIDSSRNAPGGRDMSLSDLSHYDHCMEHMYVGAKKFLTAKDGNPLDISLLGRVEPVRAVAIVEHALFDINWMEFMEKMNVQLTRLTRDRTTEAETAAAAAAAGDATAVLIPLAKMHVVLDMTGLGASHCKPSGCNFFIKHVSQVAEANYPECACGFWVVNNHWLFETAYAFCAPFFPPKTRLKIHLCGHAGSEKYEAALAPLIERKALPVILGGEQDNRIWLNLPRRIDPAACPSALSASWTVVHHIYAGEKCVVEIPMIAPGAAAAGSDGGDGAGADAVDGGGAASSAVADAAAAWAQLLPDVAITRAAVDAGAAGTTAGGVVWDFSTSDPSYDIDFSATFTPSTAQCEAAAARAGEGEGGGGAAESAAGDDEAVVEEVKHAVERLATHSGGFALEEGVVGGTLRLVFDNTFSWVRQKVVTLRVRCK